MSASGVLMGLALLLADGNGRGGGDLSQSGTVKGDASDLGYKALGKCPKHMRVECQWTHKQTTVFQTRVPSIVGSWKGDRIVVAGDYADPGQYGYDSDRVIEHVERKLPDGFSGSPKDSDYIEVVEKSVEKETNLYEVARLEFEDISVPVLAAMCQDDYFLIEHLDSMKDTWVASNGVTSRWSRDQVFVEALLLDPRILQTTREWAEKNDVPLPLALRPKVKKSKAVPDILPEFANAPTHD
ncbi:MAG: hypothetical protein JSS66_05990 [Armatimonadetes bacterium]|nr:hypothetical protein [Armatimonadota bacterium]